MTAQVEAQPVASRLRLSSALPDSYRAALEDLLFFNHGQQDVAAAIVESIERHGVPEVVCESGLLHIVVGALGRVQTLFAFYAADGGDKLVGVIAYFRASREQIMILHIAVSEGFCSDSSMAHEAVVLRLFQAVRQAATRLRGVTSILMYRPGGPVHFNVSPAPARTYREGV